MNRYNGLNSVKIDLATCGICVACGRRFTDPLCTHATTEQIEYTMRLDAKTDAEYEQKRQTAEIESDYEWLGINYALTEEMQQDITIPFAEPLDPRTAEQIDQALWEEETHATRKTDNPRIL